MSFYRATQQRYLLEGIQLPALLSTSNLLMYLFNSLSQQARREGHACMLTDLQSCLPNLLYHLTLLTLTVPRISLLSTRKQKRLTSHITHSTTAMDNPKVLHELDNGFVVRAWVRSNNLIASTNDVLTAGGAIE